MSDQIRMEGAGGLVRYTGREALPVQGVAWPWLLLGVVALLLVLGQGWWILTNETIAGKDAPLSVYTTDLGHKSLIVEVGKLKFGIVLIGRIRT